MHIGSVAVGTCREGARNVLTEWLNRGSEWNRVVCHAVSSLAAVNGDAGGDRIVEMQGYLLSWDWLCGLEREGLNGEEGLAAAAILNDGGCDKCNNCCEIGEKHDGYTCPVASVYGKFYYFEPSQHVCESPFATR